MLQTNAESEKYSNKISYLKRKEKSLSMFLKETGGNFLFKGL
jgi:hypothetical protein